MFAGDSDDDESIPRQPTPKAAKKPSSSLFGDDSDSDGGDLFGSSKKPAPSVGPKKTTSLFGGSSDDDAPAAVSKPAAGIAGALKSRVPQSDSEDSPEWGSDDEDKETPRPRKVAPAAAKPEAAVFGAPRPVGGAAKPAVSND